MVLSVPFYNILGFLYLNNSPSHFSYFLYNLLNLACFTLTVILWMVQGVASRRNSYILACISCKLVRGQYMSSQKKKKKDEDNWTSTCQGYCIPSRQKQKAAAVYETESVSVFRSRSHWQSFDDSFMQPRVYASLFHTLNSILSLKVLIINVGVALFLTYVNFFWGQYLFLLGTSAGKKAPHFFASLWEFLFRTLKASCSDGMHSWVEINLHQLKLQFWKRCSSWSWLTTAPEVVSLALRLKLASAVLCCRQNPESLS